METIKIQYSNNDSSYDYIFVSLHKKEGIIKNCPAVNIKEISSLKKIKNKVQFTYESNLRITWKLNSKKEAKRIFNQLKIALDGENIKCG